MQLDWRMPRRFARSCPVVLALGCGVVAAAQDRVQPSDAVPQVAAVSSPSPSPRGPHAPALLVTGSLHGDEVTDDAEGEWLALVRDGDGAGLVPVSVSLTAEQDMGDDEGELTGRRVEVFPAVDAIALLRGLPSVPTGHLATVLVEHAVDVGPGTSVRLHGIASRFSVVCGKEQRWYGQLQQQCSLGIEQNGVRQTLFTYRAYFEGRVRLWAADYGPTILWAGDLDLDGSLDVLLDTSDHDNVKEQRLFLSSAATGRAIVSEVARFTHVGC